MPRTLYVKCVDISDRNYPLIEGRRLDPDMISALGNISLDAPYMQVRRSLREICTKFHVSDTGGVCLVSDDFIIALSYNDIDDIMENVTSNGIAIVRADTEKFWVLSDVKALVETAVNDEIADIMGIWDDDYID